MKVNLYFYSLSIVFIDFVLFYFLMFGYNRQELNYCNIIMRGDTWSYLKSLLRFDLIILLLNSLFLFIGYKVFLIKRDTYSKSLFYFFYCSLIFNVINSLMFLVNNFIRNYFDEFELNPFVILLEEYGLAVNLTYIAPFVISVVVFILFCLFKKINAFL